MKRFIKLSATVFIISFVALFYSNSTKADIHSGTREFYGVKYNSSVNSTFKHNGNTYNYRNTFDNARFEWSGHSGISLPKTEHSWADVYYVGSTSEPGLIGRVFPVNGYLDNVSMDSNWLFVRVYIYHNNMNKLNMSANQRFSNATHEIGHTVKMKHPTSYTGSSVMHQGIQSIGATSYDYSELSRKWK